MRIPLSESQKIQLLIQFFNKFNCWNVEVLKVNFIGMAILHGYVGIRSRQKNLLISAFCALVYVLCILCYCATFNRAHRLKELQKQLKRELKAACAKPSPNSVLNKESFKAAVNALSCPGLKVGSFHEMERQSALIFQDFVVGQIISLLVAF